MPRRRSPALSVLLCCVLLNTQLFLVPTAQAAMVSTASALAAETRDAREGRILSALQRTEAQRLLAGYGLEPAQVEQRLARLSDAEIARLADRADSLPAGGDALEFVLVVFLVLLLLELLGAIDIFPRI